MEAFWALKELKITTMSLKRIRGKRQSPVKKIILSVP